MAHDQAPQDTFKIDYVPKMGIKDVPTKINNVLHCSNDVFKKEAEITSGYRNQSTWSTQFNDTRCVGNNRTFDKIVAESKAKESAEVNREKKLQEYFS